MQLLKIYKFTKPSSFALFVNRGLLAKHQIRNFNLRPRPPSHWPGFSNSIIPATPRISTHSASQGAAAEKSNFVNLQILSEEEFLSRPRHPHNPSSDLAKAYYRDLVGTRPRRFVCIMEGPQKSSHPIPEDGDNKKRPASESRHGRPSKKFKQFGRNEFKRAAKQDWEARKAEFERTGKDPAAENPDRRGLKHKRFIESATRGPREVAEGEEKEERKPKKKVAVLIGYCGTGYKGMQLNPPTKTIEGDLFEAFVKAGAISKANSDDPKKSSLVRCARTDKGVHAAGNVISLKLIIESPTVIEDINTHLAEQIRIWDIIPTTNGFSCYQFCDSRVYEYLIPTYCFLAPHPNSFIAKRMAKLAEEENDMDSWKDRYDDMPDFWENVSKAVKAELEEQGFSPDIIQQVLSSKAEDSDEQLPSLLSDVHDVKVKGSKDEGTEIVEEGRNVEMEDVGKQDIPPKIVGNEGSDLPETTSRHEFSKGLSAARKLQKQVIMRLKRAFRIPPLRLERVRSAFALYEGNHSFHNFTIQKTFKDPSSRRYIKTFKVSNPIIIDNTEWLSLKVHGQSFMMHQIRKMVGMVMLTIRYGCPLDRIEEAYGQVVIPIPKAPALGLLLDHPVFDTYNRKADLNDRGHITFEKHQAKIQDFKQKHIYDKLFLEEQKLNTFHAFLSFLDNFETNEFEYLSSRGMKAIPEVRKGENKHELTKEQPFGSLIDGEDDEDTNDIQDG